MAETASPSDKGIGLALLFGLVGLLGVVVMYVSVEEHVVAAGGFGLAIVAGCLAIAALHLYD